MSDSENSEILDELKCGIAASDWQERVRILSDAQSALDAGMNRNRTDAALELLAPYLCDRKWEVRRAALYALYASKDAKVKRHIEKCLDDNNRWVRQAAGKLLDGFTAYPPIVKEDPIRDFVFSLVKDLDVSKLKPEELYRIAIAAGNKFYEELASDTIHEVFNATTPMMGYLKRLKEHLEQKGILDAESKMNIGKIESQFDRIYNMLKNLKEFSLEYAEDFEAITLHSVMSESLEQAREKSGKHVKIGKIQVEMDISPDISLFGNKSRLVSMFMNLMTNAFESMPKGGKLKVIAGIHKDYVEVEISDTGLGFEEDKTETLMKRFKTTKKNIGGTGLGLPIAKKTAEKHNGELILKSKKNEGTTAIVRLPVEQNKNE